ncbi:hypothetical protein ABZ505_25825 [Nocardia niwae]
MVPERGSRRSTFRRVYRDPRSREGPHHLRRGEHPLHRDRERDPRAPRGPRGRGGRFPHEHWGERPAAFVSLRPGAELSSGDLRAHLLDRLAKFKVPDRIEFATLPKTATGKIQKFQLEQQLIAHPPG